MLTVEENEELCRVGPGTPMGELMRRYWQPVAASAQLVEQPVQKVRVLGEDLVVFRDTQSRLGALAEACGHRGISLRFGFPDEEGLRCGYDGWLFDHGGNCVETPGEPDDDEYKKLLKIRSYAAQELGGLIWVYLGPEPAPLLPRWDVLVWNNAFRQIGATMLPCNWLQCMENAVDILPDEPAPGAEAAVQSAETAGGPGAIRVRAAARWSHIPRLEFERYEHGILKRRLDDGQAGAADDPRDPLVFPMMVRLGSGFHNELQIRVPVDDTHTWHVVYQCFVPGPKVDVPAQEAVPFYEIPFKDEQGELIRESSTQEKMAIWVSQGEVVDRTKEYLVSSDRGLLLYRRLLKQQIAVVEDGGEPINVLRDPQRNQRINLQPAAQDGPADAQRPLSRPAIGEDVERYSPVLDQLVDLYRKYREARAAQAAE